MMVILSFLGKLCSGFDVLDPFTIYTGIYDCIIAHLKYILFEIDHYYQYEPEIETRKLKLIDMNT